MGVVTSLHCLFSKIHIGFTFLVPAHLGSPGKRAVKRVCVCVSQVIGYEDRPRSDLYCVEWSVKLYSNQASRKASNVFTHSCLKKRKDRCVVTCRHYHSRQCGVE